MSTDLNRGYVGFLLLTIVAIIVGVGSFLLYERNSSAPAYVAENPPQEIKINQMALVFGSNNLQYFTGYNVSSSTVLNVSENTIPTKKEVTPPIEKGVAFLDKPQKANLVATTTSITIRKSTPQSMVADAISEPTLVVTKGLQPTHTLLLGNARRVPFTVVELKAVGGDVTVDSLEITRMGLASDRVFTEVGVLGLDFERALNANHIYTTREGFTIKDDESREIVLFGNITDTDTLGTYESQMPSLALTNIKTSAKISGILPIVGTTHTVNSSLVIGSLSLDTSGFDPGTNRTLYINSQNVIFSAVRATIGGAEPVKLTEFSFTQNGSASPKDLTNVQICVVYKANMQCYTADADDAGKYYTVDFPDNTVIDKGESADIYIKGDIGTTGANRTIDFDITTSYDIIAYGTNYKNYIYGATGGSDGAQPEGSFSDTEYPFYNGYKHTISGGTFGNISK